jgi:hypothetical protein
LQLALAAEEMQRRRSPERDCRVQPVGLRVSALSARMV